MTVTLEQPERVPLWQRALLPSEVYDSPHRSSRDWLVDAFAFAGAVAVGGFALADLWDGRSGVFNALDVIVGSLACIALWLRRMRPLAVGVLTVAASAFFALALGAALVGMFTTAARARGRGVGVVALLAVTASVVFPLVNPDSSPFLKQRFPGFMVTAICFGWGLFVRVRRDLVSSLRERADRLEAERERQVEQARDAERRRIAREMHDVLAHRLSLLSLQAGALELRPGASDEETEQAGAIRESAAAALAELRDVIAVLREDADGSLSPPQPTMRQLPSLLDESRSAGMKLRARIDVPNAESLPVAVSRTAYRIVQEGLTNARKHAPNAPVLVSVSPDEDRLVVEVVSGRSSPTTDEPGRGAGLIGLSERVALVGGELERGPNENGEFVLRAKLPRAP
jgi:signal transduction histidine kinase